MRVMNVSKRQFSVVIGAAFALSLAACSDSTGPRSTDADGALQSLVMGLGGMTGTGSIIGMQMGGSASKLAHFVDQVDVTIGGKSYTMYGLGMRVTFPAGTCLNTLFTAPSVIDLSLPCEDPLLTTSLIFWQSSSRFTPPDRLLIISGDPGIN